MEEIAPIIFWIFFLKEGIMSQLHYEMCALVSCIA